MGAPGARAAEVRLLPYADLSNGHIGDHGAGIAIPEEVAAALHFEVSRESRL
jgi:hypothetical protein